MLVKEERERGGGGGGVVSLLLCVSSYLGNKPKHLLFLTVAHRDTHDLSLSLSLLIIFSLDFPHLVIFHLLLHVVFSLSLTAPVALSHTHTKL